VRESNEAELRIIFETVAEVREIRMVKEKYFSGFKDFAFIDFNSVEDAKKVLDAAKHGQFCLKEQPLHVSFSRPKKAGGEEVSLESNQVETKVSAAPPTFKRAKIEQDMKRWGRSSDSVRDLDKGKTVAKPLLTFEVNFSQSSPAEPKK